MPPLARLTWLWRNFFRKQQVERDLDEEIRSHVEMLVEQRIRSGVDPQTARRAVLVEVGGIEQIKEEVRGVRVGSFTSVRSLRCAMTDRQRPLP